MELSVAQRQVQRAAHSAGHPVGDANYSCYRVSAAGAIGSGYDGGVVHKHGGVSF